MTTIYTINFTDSATNGFTINPGQFDGFGGTSANSSLVLQGNGNINWGETVNENFLHLLEHFASPARVLPIIVPIESADNTGAVGTHSFLVSGDISNVFINGFQFDIVNSTANINDGTYTTDSSSYDGNTNKTEIIIQEAFPDQNAITLGTLSYDSVEPEPALVKPPYVEGQLWFNKSDGNFYVYKKINSGMEQQWINNSSSVTIEPIAPTSPELGQLWYDTSLEQLMIFDGTNWVSVADRYILKDGDVLPITSVLDFGGELQINPKAGNAIGSHINSTGVLYISGRESVVWQIDSDNDGSGNFGIRKGIMGDVSDVPLLTIENNGLARFGVSSYETLLLGDNDIPNKKYVDDINTSITSSFLPLSGGTMTGDIEFAAPTGTDSPKIVFQTSHSDPSSIYKHEPVNDVSEIRISVSDDNVSGDFFSIGYTFASVWNEFFRVESTGIASGTPNAIDITNNEHLTNKAYVDNEISNSISSALSSITTVPISTIFALGTSTVPSGFLECNGAELDRSLYVDLFNVIGTTFGVGNGSTTFNLPDLRGEFIRGWDNGRGVDSGRTIGGFQGDAIRNITGVAGGKDDQTLSIVNGAFYRYSSFGYDAGSSLAGGGWRLGFDASRVVPTANDNRPRNISLMYIIKY